MRVPFVDLKVQYQSIKSEINAAISGILENSSFILGRSVEEFEKRFAEEHGVRYCHGVSSGTAGNHLVLWSLGIGPGDEVIIPVNTFIATAWGATLCGATPVFVDCEPGSYNIDPGEVERKITPKTRAIVAVHLYGQAANLDPLLKIASDRNVTLVEDCAQAHFAEYGGKRVGSFGRASSFSFYPGKNLGAYGEAGAVATNDPELARKFRMMRDHGSERKYSHDIQGHNYRMGGMQGAILGVKLRHLHEWTEARRRHAYLYDSLLRSVPQVDVPVRMPSAHHVFHLYVIRARRRDALRKHLELREISTGMHYPIPLHLQPVFAGLRYKRGDFPVAEASAAEMLSLPMYPELTGEQIHHVCDSIREFFQ